jgi:hypothetical protein
VAKLTTPKISVILKDPAFTEPDEGAEHTVQTLNVDLVAYDRERMRYGWPKGDDAPFIWLTFLSWKALQRIGQFAGSLAEFEQVCLSVSSVDANEVDPTQRAVTDE